MTQDLEAQQDSFRGLILPGLLGILWLVLLAPLFIRMPVTNDAVLYDLEARWLLDGVLPYQDILEVNFPGVLVIHYCTRTIFGDSDEALKFADLLIFSMILLVAMSLVKFISESWNAAAWAGSLALLFYLSQSEWCHCQRDTWLLLPALLGCILRTRQVDRSLDQEPLTTFGYSVLEGLVWGCGIWLKPHLLVICVTAWVLSLFMVEGINRKSTDGFGLLVGGLIAGGLGLWGLSETGVLEAFLLSLQEWNPGYLAARFENWKLVRYVGMVYRFTPWSLLHLFAIPIALRAVYLFFFQTRDVISFGRVLLCSIYLVWFLQSHLLQHLFDYVHVPALLLAIFVLAAHLKEFKVLQSPALLISFVLVAVLTSPIASMQKMKHWPTAVQRDLTPAQTDQIAQLPNPNWEDLNKVEEYLRGQKVQGDDVLMYNSDLVTLYWDLELNSPTPYVYLFELQHFFPERKELFNTATAEGKQKFIVTDLVSCGMPMRLAEEVDELGELAPPPGYRRANLKHYPWSEPVVFRAGRYLVHRDRSQGSAESKKE